MWRHARFVFGFAVSSGRRNRASQETKMQEKGKCKFGSTKASSRGSTSCSKAPTTGALLPAHKAGASQSNVAAMPRNQSSISLSEFEDPPDESVCLRASWEKMVKRLVEFKKENGNMNVPRDYDQTKHNQDTDDNEAKLGNWVLEQHKFFRELKENGKRKIYKYRYICLKEIGFDFDFEPFKTKFMEKYEALKKFKKEHGPITCVTRMKWNKLSVLIIISRETWECQ